MLLEKHPILLRPILVAVVGILFCFFSLHGNDVNFCSTAGCGLYHDTKIAGLSLWWYGIGAFTLISLLTLFAQSRTARLAAGSFLFADTLLLLLLAVTAPCVSCLTVAMLFALIYYLLRSATLREYGKPKRTSILLSVWGIFFFLNIWAVVKAEMGPWPMLGEADEAKIHLYFSPSCQHCRDAVEFYAGNMQTAFYPIADNDQDIYKTYALLRALEAGTSIDLALKEAQKAHPWSLLHNLRPEILLLRFRMLENKAHVFLAGSQGVPHIEYHGMPSIVARELKKRRKLFEEIEADLDSHDQESASPLETKHLPPRDFNVPSELDSGTEQQCLRGRSCP